MNLHIFNRDLRYKDNTSLIENLKKYKNITPIFIFDPKQADRKKNSYFSDNAFQFMIETLSELNINCPVSYFYGHYIDVLKSLHKQFKINSISFNFDYSPYAMKRTQDIIEWADDNIDIICKEDYLLYDILDGKTLKKDGTPYLVFTPYRNHLWNNLKVNEVDKFKDFNFIIPDKLKTNEYYFNFKDVKQFYINNDKVNVHGGRKNALKILKNIGNFKNYSKCRDLLTYKTTFLGAHNHFSTVSIREVYWAIANKLGKKCGLINELHWRQFYYEISYRFPKTLQGQISDKLNAPLKSKYNKIKWSDKLLDAWCDGKTGFPLIDAGMRQLNTTGFMHNRNRMCVASFAIKNLHLDWRLLEKYFATKLVDYDAMVNNGSWQWVAGCGTDAQPWFRIFNIWTQAKKYDPECEYIKFWIPELKNVPNKDIFEWYEAYKKWPDYIKPIIEHDETRKETIKMYSKALKI